MKKLAKTKDISSVKDRSFKSLSDSFFKDELFLEAIQISNDLSVCDSFSEIKIEIEKISKISRLIENKQNSFLPSESIKEIFEIIKGGSYKESSVNC